MFLQYNGMTRCFLAASLAQGGMLVLPNHTHPCVCLITQLFFPFSDAAAAIT
jgi:hypothetical protein